MPRVPLDPQSITPRTLPSPNDPYFFFFFLLFKISIFFLNTLLQSSIGSYSPLWNFSTYWSPWRRNLNNYLDAITESTTSIILQQSTPGIEPEACTKSFIPLASPQAPLWPLTRTLLIVDSSPSSPTLLTLTLTPAYKLIR